jgi:UPF0755 protein
MGKRKILVGFILVFTVTLSSFSFYFWQVITAPNILVDQESRFFYIQPNATFKDVQNTLYDENYVNDLVAFSFLAKLMDYDKYVKPGRYLLESNMSNRDAIRYLRSGKQEPVNITFNNVRLLEDLPPKICANINLDPESFMTKLEDSTLRAKHGFNDYTFKCMFIPNTYEVFWTITADELVERMSYEYKQFWNDEREAKADSIGLSPIEVSVLASIVQAECKMKDEAPVIAGLYLNRLKRNYLLQADPTVVYANGDFTINRVLNKHKEIESPYNTYKYRGLPPGPINAPEIRYLDAVLNHAEHNYLYMCAKEDFSGYHNFSTNLQQHMVYARRYQRALNREGIYR